MMRRGSEALQARGAVPTPARHGASGGSALARAADLPRFADDVHGGLQRSAAWQHPRSPSLFWDMSMASTCELSRRLFLQSCGAFVASGASGAGARQDTEAPAPASHRHALGAQELIVLSDGHLVVPTAMLARNVGGTELSAYLASLGIGPQLVHFHINVALISAGDEHILIDAGSGGTWEPTAGYLADSLQGAGIAPEAIGKVVITHAHPDHIWGLIDELDNSLRFPRAQYLVSAREWEFWTGTEAARLQGPIEGIAAGAKRVFKAIAERTSCIRPGSEIAPGIVALDTKGHTPGHVSLLLTAGANKLLITGDAVQNNHIALAHPHWQPGADMDGAQAAESRRQLLDLAATDQLQVLSYHMPFPGLGRVERKGAAFAWTAEL
jgi:glyoxylase-like metal-dependent hydrolase (beta-lactamase superfamily II)